MSRVDEQVAAYDQLHAKVARTDRRLVGIVLAACMLMGGIAATNVVTLIDARATLATIESRQVTYHQDSARTNAQVACEIEVFDQLLEAVEAGTLSARSIDPGEQC